MVNGEGWRRIPILGIICTNFTKSNLNRSYNKNIPQKPSNVNNENTIKTKSIKKEGSIEKSVIKTTKIINYSGNNNFSSASANWALLSSSNLSLGFTIFDALW